MTNRQRQSKQTDAQGNTITYTGSLIITCIQTELEAGRLSDIQTDRRAGRQEGNIGKQTDTQASTKTIADKDTHTVRKRGRQEVRQADR